MKNAICAIGKCENKYIEEWVAYYYHLEFSKIYLYDNNDTWGEYFESAIQPFINNGFVEIINYRGKKVCQCEAYQDCWDKHKYEYDWIGFLDCDEFLTILHNDKFNSINELLNSNIYKDFDMIHFNFLTYGDNELLDNDTNSVRLTFKDYLPINSKGPLDIPNNCHVKTFIKGHLTNDKQIYWVRQQNKVGDPHSPFCVNINCCNEAGESLPNAEMSVCQMSYKYAAIRHYSTKTITEAIINKFRRGFPDQICHCSISELVKQIGIFFSFNTITNKKLDKAKDIVYDLFEKDNKYVVSEARGRIGNTLFTVACGAYYAEQNNKEFCLYLNHDDAQYIKDGKWYTDWLLTDDIFNKVKVVDNTDFLGYGYVDCYEKNSVEYNELPVLDNTSVFIHGFRQSYKYCPSREWCRNYFKPSKNLVTLITSKYPGIDKLVSINIRRGDFLNPANDWIMKVNPLDWYNKVISEYPSTQKFLIVSDDIEWCKQNFKGNRFLFEEGIDRYDKIFTDLFVQTFCKDNIISNSTFSWWAAYLNIHDNRKVYYQGPWYKVFDCTDIIPDNDNWINYE